MIGFLNTRRDPNKIKKLYAYQVVAQAEGIGMFYFTPRRVNLSEQTIRGLTYIRGMWVEETFPYPDVIYNDGYPNYAWGARVIDQLYDIVPITSHSIGDKLTVYQKLKNGRKFAEFLIPSIHVQTSHQVIHEVSRHKWIVMKPLSGRQGNGVVRIARDAGDFIVTDRVAVQRYRQAGFVEFLEGRLRECGHLVQPFIVCKTKAGDTYDFRIHVQKNGQGKWDVTSVYPRIAEGGGIVPNISGGGYTTIPKHFFAREFGDEAINVQQSLSNFGLHLSKHMDEIYGASFDELGIDVGMDGNHRIWIFEINWRPGPPPIWNVELDVARNSVLYAAYLANRNS